MRCATKNRVVTPPVTAGWHFLHLADKIWIDPTEASLLYVFEDVPSALTFYKKMLNDVNISNAKELSAKIATTSLDTFQRRYKDLFAKHYVVNSRVAKARYFHNVVRYIAAGVTLLLLPLYCVLTECIPRERPDFTALMAVFGVIGVVVAMYKHLAAAREYFKALHVAVIERPV